MNIEISFWNTMLKEKQDIDTYILIYDRQKYYELKSNFTSYNEFKEHSFAIYWDNKFYDVIVLSKNKTINYQSVKLLRNVLAPYVVKDANGNSTPRGWFYGENGKPQRYTGVSNSMYFSKSKWDTDFSAPFLYLLLSMFTNFNNDVVYSNINCLNVVKTDKEFLEYANHHFMLET